MKRQPRHANEEGRAVDGKPIIPGDVFYTRSGGVTSPYPKQKREKYSSEWLIVNASDEARRRGDTWNARIFSNETLLSDGRLPNASRESMLMYLFGEQPAVVKSIFES